MSSEVQATDECLMPHERRAARLEQECEKLRIRVRDLVRSRDKWRAAATALVKKKGVFIP
jgi:hypothetical protein